MPLQILAAHVAFSATGLLLGLVIALIVYVVALLVARETGAGEVRSLGLIIALVIILVFAFDVVGT
jgi:hypothetical protein